MPTSQANLNQPCEGYRASERLKANGQPRIPWHVRCFGRGRVNIERIDFISEYCDRWCERCAYTMRCSAFATEAAMGMCGDFEEAVRLAVGIPQPVGPERPEPPWLLELDSSEPTAAALAEFQQQEERREQRIHRRL